MRIEIFLILFAVAGWLAARSLIHTSFTPRKKKWGLLTTLFLSLSMRIADVHAAPPPDVVTMVTASKDAYSNTPSAVGDYTPVATAGRHSGDFGFGATAYKNGDQIIIAVRGTDPADAKNTIYNLISDKSFGGGTPTAAMVEEAKQLTDFIAAVAKQNPGANISLTGHSLGGALAQMAALAARVQATTFDSPGPMDAYYRGRLQEIFAHLQALNIKSNSESITNYRAYGDQISKVGQQLGAEFTVDQDKSRLEIDSKLTSNWLSNHSIDMLQRQIIKACGQDSSSCAGVPRMDWCDLSVCGSSPMSATLAKVMAGYGANGFKVTELGCKVGQVFGSSFSVNVPTGTGYFWRAECKFAVGNNPNFPGMAIVVTESADSLSPTFAAGPSGENVIVQAGSAGPALGNVIVGVGKTLEGGVLARANAVSDALGNFIKSMIDNGKEFITAAAIAAADLVVSVPDIVAKILLDPPPGDAYRVTQDTDAPKFTAVELPVNDVIAGWAVKYHDENGWSDITKQLGVGTFNFASSVDTFDAVPLGLGGHPVFNDSPFLISATFDRSGAGLTTIYTMTAAADNGVPEPMSISLFALGVLAIALVHRLAKNRQ